MAPVNLDYLPAEYSFDRGFHFLIPSRDKWNPDSIVTSANLDIYKLDNGVGSGVCFVILDQDISLRLPDNCSMFQAKVMTIYRAG